MAIVPDSSSVDADVIRQEAEVAGERCNVFVDFYPTTTKEEQLQVLQIAVDSDVDGILLYPLESIGYTSALAKCVHKDIPVVAISRRPELAVFHSFIGATDKSERMAMLSCVSATEGKGTLMFMDRQVVDGLLCMEVVVLEPIDPDHETVYQKTKTRVKELVETPFEGYQVRNIAVLNENQASSSNLYSAVQQLLISYQPDAVFSHAEEVTDVIVNCVDNHESLKGTYVIGHGNPKDYLDHLKDGTINGVVTQNDAYSASLGVRFLAQLINGSPMPENADSGITIITAYNMERFFTSEEK